MGAESKERIARYREILTRDPMSRVYVPLADLLRENGELEESLSLLEDGLALNPEHQAAMVVLGRTLLQAGREEHGVKVLEMVLELSPENFVVLRALSERFLSRNAFALAIPKLEKLVETEPEQPEWPKLLADAKERMLVDVEKSSGVPMDPQLEEADPNQPEQEFATMTLVDILVAQGYLDKALEALHRMKDVDPAREDVEDRILNIRKGISRLRQSTDSGTGPHQTSLPDKQARAQIRANQKKQFGEWIDGLNSGEDKAL